MSELDAISLEVIKNQLEEVAEEMGEVLIRGAYSANIKEREDCSTALFDHHGRQIAQAEHIPVHLGAMPDAVAAVREREPVPGEIWMLNDPFIGGTHLPDITLVSPVGAPDGSEGTLDDILGYVVSRAHYADVGGSAPGSMPAVGQEIYVEGIRIPPTRVATHDGQQKDIVELILSNMRGTAKRQADFSAQVAAHSRGAERLKQLSMTHGKRLTEAYDAVIEYSAERMEAELAEIPDGEYQAQDVLRTVESESIDISVTIRVDGKQVYFDFTETSDQVQGNLNAPQAVTKSAVYFVARCLTDPDIPPNAGCYRPIQIHIPDENLLNPDQPAAVVGGNVETSQRVADVLFAAFGEAEPQMAPAHGQGTMNNLVIGSRRSGFTYYETIGGGAGASATSDGEDGVQVGMTNTLNTPIEVIETEYPLRVERYELRQGSGGAGVHSGGDGVVRTLRICEPATISLLTGRRDTPPEGIDEGECGSTGSNRIGGKVVPGKITTDVESGTTVTVKTPGGGGHGNPVTTDDETDE
ncbi:MAG: N-methylhydantoinase B/acetone carboxylase, alpha subunit [Haloquadratum sp. J07HQX50]|nr:MAG: N-methylhydantoinase B/acetone carboxylase, alpha subunit [Haloquadratum sp. J07HQX50]